MNFGITNLTAGEVSPTFLGRPDVGRYANACQRLENFMLTATGMWSYRPGFELMGFPAVPGQRVRLWPFQFSDQQAYMLEIGNLYIRFWHSSGQVVAGGPPAPVEVETAFPMNELELLGFAQSADFLFIVNELRGVFALKRRSHTDWSISSFKLKDGPYGIENADSGRTLAITGTVEPLANVVAVGFPPGEEPFGAGDEGRLIRIKDGTVWRWVIVTAVSDSTHVEVSVQNGPFTVLTAGTPTIEWRLGLYSTRLGFPATATLHEQRLVLGGPPLIPDRVDGSAVAAFENFAPGVDGGDAYGYALGTKNVNRVNGFAVANDLIAFTGGSENRISGDSTGAAITPTQIWQKPISPDGAKRVPAVEIGNSVVFIDKLGQRLMALSYNIGLQSYAPDNLNLLADHMPWQDENSPGFQALCWQATPIGTIWTIRGNGQLAGCLFDVKEQVLGWHRHPMGELLTEEGEPPVGDSPIVISCATMKGPTHDELWVAVQRDCGDGTVLSTIERMKRPGLWDAPSETLLHLDCGLSHRFAPTADVTLAAREGTNVLATLSNVTGGFAFQAGDVGRFLKRRYLAGYDRRGRPMWRQGVARITSYVSPTQVRVEVLVRFPAKLKAAAGVWGLTVTEITGLDHLNGFLVTAVSDGRVCEAKLVEGGTLPLDVPGWEVHAGLPYEGWMVSMPIDPGPSPVVGQTRLARVDRISARLLNSIGGEFGAMPEREEEPLRLDPVKPYKQRDAAPQAPPPAFSGDVELRPAGSWTKRAEIVIAQRQPLPFNVQLVIAHTYAPFVQP